MDNSTDKMPELPIPTDGKTGKMFFEWMMFPYYRTAFEVLVERQRRYGPENILKAGEWGVMEQIQNKVSRARAQLNGSIAAGSVVTRNIPPMTLCQGNPAAPVARGGVPLVGSVSYQEFLKKLKPYKR